MSVAIGKFFQYPARWAKKAVKIRERETHSVQFSIKMAFYQVCCLALRLMSTRYNNIAALFVIYYWFLSLSDPGRIHAEFPLIVFLSDHIKPLIRRFFAVFEKKWMEI